MGFWSGLAASVFGVGVGVALLLVFGVGSLVGVGTLAVVVNALL